MVTKVHSPFNNYSALIWNRSPASSIADSDEDTYDDSDEEFDEDMNKAASASDQADGCGPIQPPAEFPDFMEVIKR